MANTTINTTVTGATAMVTARMDKEKKSAGSQILDELGTTPSQLINDLYDYIITNEQIPIEISDKTSPISQLDHEERLSQSLAHVDAIPHVQLDSRYAHMDTRDARKERLGIGEDKADARTSTDKCA